MRHVQNASTLSLLLEMRAARARQNTQTEGEKPSPALRICELFYHVIFNWKFVFREVGKTLFWFFKGEFNSRHHNIFLHCFLWGSRA